MKSARWFSFLFILVLIILTGSFNYAYADVTEGCQVTKAAEAVKTDITCSVHIKDQELAKLSPGDQVVCVFKKGGIAFIPYLEDQQLKATSLATSNKPSSTDKDGTKRYKIKHTLGSFTGDILEGVWNNSFSAVKPGSDRELLTLSCGVYAKDG
jgi:hypothetical protein